MELTAAADHRQGNRGPRASVSRLALQFKQALQILDPLIKVQRQHQTGCVTGLISLVIGLVVAFCGHLYILQSLLDATAGDRDAGRRDQDQLLDRCSREARLSSALGPRGLTPL